MSFKTFLSYVRAAMPQIPWMHWVILGIITLAVVWWGLKRKKDSLYGGVVLGLAFFYGLFLLDALVVNRPGVVDWLEPDLDLVAEYHRMLQGNVEYWVFQLFNVAVFIPFGWLVSECIAENKGKRSWGLAVLIAFGFSLLIESLQWFFRVGFFEVTDLVLNTFGAAVGAAMAIGMRALVRRMKKV